MSDPIDLDAVRRHGAALTNGVEDVMPMGDALEVTIDPEAKRLEVAEAIAAAGPLLLALAAENEAQRAALALIERLADALNSKLGALVARLEVLP